MLLLLALGVQLSHTLRQKSRVPDDPVEQKPFARQVSVSVKKINNKITKQPIKVAKVAPSHSAQAAGDVNSSNPLSQLSTGRQAIPLHDTLLGADLDSSARVSVPMRHHSRSYEINNKYLAVTTLQAPLIHDAVGVNMEGRLALSRQSGVKTPDGVLQRYEIKASKPLLVAYLDKLIDPGIGVEDEYFNESNKRQAIALDDRLPGYLGVDYRYYNAVNNGDVSSEQSEHGISTVVNQQTEQLGSLQIMLNGAKHQADPEEDLGTRTRATLSQRDFALSPQIKMNNHLGHVQLRGDSLLLGSQQIRLGLPFVEGFNSEVTAAGERIYLIGGRILQQDGRTFPVVSKQSASGELYGLSYSKSLMSHWQGGLHFMHVKDSASTNNHNTALGAMEYSDSANNYMAQIHTMASEGGARGIWLDSRFVAAGWVNSLGVYHLAEGLQWVNSSAAIADNRQGGYWRTQMQRSRYGLGLALDMERPIKEEDGGPQRWHLLGQGQYKLGRNTHVQGSLGYEEQRYSNTAATSETKTVNLTSRVNRKTHIGSSAVSLNMSRHIEPQSIKDWQFIWDHQWPRMLSAQLHTGIMYELTEKNTQNRDQTSLKAGVSSNFTGVSLSAELHHGIYGDGTVEGRSSSLNTNIAWLLNRHWNLGLTMSWNKNVTQLIDDVETLHSGRYLLLSLNFDESWGRPLKAVGVSSQCLGFGVIRGKIYLDKNNNGNQEPDEPGLANVILRLDGGFDTQTDDKGEYRFSPVPCGPHQLEVEIATVPLPWGLVEEGPLTVDISTRETITRDFGLQDVNTILQHSP